MGVALRGEVVVVGSGFAGAATAYHLTRLGVRNVVLVEQEDLPGRHASARNAAMARTTAVPPSIAPLAAEGLRFFAEPPADLGCGPLLRSCGMLVLASGRQAADLREALPRSWLAPDDVARLVPVTSGGRFDGAVWGPRDGVVDIALLLARLLAAARARGARLLTGERAVAINIERGRVTGVVTGRGTIEARWVVNAAGAWAGGVASLAHAAPVPLRPCRRHLFATAALPWVKPTWPIVWDVTHGFYFRPEPPGLLLSPCDETEHAPGLPSTDPAAAEELATKLERFMPVVSGVEILASWAGLRTLGPDGCFVLGRDPEVDGFVWCAGLGGHGMTTCPSVGRIAAEAVLGRPAPAEHAAARFAPTEA
ncbi:MAG TPA: FAD-binding oxidoreductase [Vicinamibacteria bacterium]|nr:FAD-binding oxidoreductase [Vicinamibacteria bacterium]